MGPARFLCATPRATDKLRHKSSYIKSAFKHGLIALEGV